MLDNIDLSRIQDENARELIMRLLNLVEKQAADLRDEVNRLKGEQGKPKIKRNTPKPPLTNHSSEKERHKPRQRHKSSEKAEIQINREHVVEVDPSVLPPDAEYKGHEDVVVQDILLQTDNILFHKQKYYATSTRRTYLAQLPLALSSEQDLDERAFLERLEAALPQLSLQQHKALIDAAAVAAYHAETDFPVVQALVCDDAPQFNWLSREMMLCWVHAGRPFKKLT